MYGIALEGGGALGGAHVGVLRALIENNLAPDMLAGTSAGAIVAGTYAWRGRLEDAREALEESARMGYRMLDINLLGIASGAVELLTRRNFTMDGLFKGNRLENWIDRMTGGTRIADCALPLAIPAVDLISGRVVAFASSVPHHLKDYLWETDAALSQAVRASASIPVVFRPYQYKRRVLVDGGVLENLPARVQRAMGADRVLGVMLDAPTGAQQGPDDVITVGQRTIGVMQRRLARSEACAASYLLRVMLPAGSGLFSFGELERFEAIGYETALRALPEIRAAMDDSYDGGICAAGV